MNSFRQEVRSPFGAILREVVENTPGAIGGAFAAHDGETVDAFSTWDPIDWAVLTAHYGIVLNHVQSALHTFHYGSAHRLMFHHDELDLVIEQVSDGYFVLLAIEPPSPLALALSSIGIATAQLREEMR